MADYTVLSSRVISMLCSALESGVHESDTPPYLAAVQALQRDASAIYGRGRDATTDDKLQLRQLFELLSTVRSVSDFVRQHRGNALFSEVNPYRKFGQDGAWIFEQLTDRWASRSYDFEDGVSVLLDAFKSFDFDKYSAYGNEEDSYLTKAERSLMREESI